MFSSRYDLTLYVVQVLALIFRALDDYGLNGPGREYRIPR